jgi:hypothetical protein
MFSMGLECKTNLNVKKKSSLCHPSTTIMQKMDFGRAGFFSVIGGPKIGFSFTLNRGGRLIVGSASSADIRIEARGISRKHVCLYWSNDKIYIEDQQSSNGTFVNKRKITSATEIKSGDQIAVGATTVFKCS